MQWCHLSIPKELTSPGSPFSQIRECSCNRWSISVRGSQSYTDMCKQFKRCVRVIVLWGTSIRCRENISEYTTSRVSNQGIFTTVMNNAILIIPNWIINNSHRKMPTDFNQAFSSNKHLKGKRSSMPRPQSTIEDLGTGFRSDLENDSMLPAFRVRLHYLFKQIEREFDLLHQENQSCTLLRNNNSDCVWCSNS